MPELTFDLPRGVTRIWDLEVPIIVDKPNKAIAAYIAGAIDEPFNYNELCYQLQHAPDDYTVTLHINTPGGIVDSAFMIAEAITSCSAKVVGKLSGTVASAGTMITMACDEVVITPHLSFMIHNYSGGMAGKGHEMKARQKFTDEHLNDAFKSFYSGFLTEEEMDKVIEGTDMWMGSSEVLERWNARIESVKGSV